LTNVATLIADMVRAGVDPELIGRAAEALSQREPVRVIDEQAERRRAKDRDRKRLRNSAESAVSVEDDGLSSPEGSSPKPLSPKPLQSIPPSAPKGASSPAETDLAFDAWDAMADRTGLAKVRVRSKARVTGLAGVIRQHGLPVLLEAIGRVEASAFCRGENERGWRADLDFLLQAKSFGRLLEGHFDNRARGSPKQPNPSLSDAFGVVTNIAETRNETRFSDSFEGPQRSIPHLSRVQAG
jgi:hypothetical protein